jgi:hypothetical protein
MMYLDKKLDMIRLSKIQMLTRESNYSRSKFKFYSSSLLCRIVNIRKTRYL